MIHRNAQSVRQGAAATELAILLPFLLLLFGVILDFARVYSVAQTLDNSAHAGVLFASGAAWTPSLTSDAATEAKRAACAEAISLSPPLAGDNVTVSQNGNTVTVTVEYDCLLITPILNPSQQVHLTRTIVMNRVPSAGE